MTASTEHGERLARLEGAYVHLATKADIAELRSKLRSLKWFIAVSIAGAGVIASIIAIIVP